ncbi:MAG: flagellar export protein FliJ [Deltaproteobacteria bacterium]|nr:flagellar export protein FliJ [Deltaproteobacteria bacterium]
MYRFRFESVLRYRQQAMDQVRREFSELQRKLVTEYSRLDLLEQTGREYARLFHERQGEGIAIREVGLFQSFFHRLHFETDAQRKKLYSLNQRVEGKRQELLDASKKKKVLERLREVEEDQYREEERKREQRQYDEIAVNKITRAQAIWRAPGTDEDLVRTGEKGER